MLVFTKRMIKDKYKSLLVYCLAAVGFLEMYVALFPTFQGQSDQVNQLLKTMPPEVFKALNLDPSSLSFSNFQSYLSTEYMSFLWPILAVIFALSLAAYICVNEINNGTIETLMSLPANRYRIYTERYFAGLLMLAVFCASSIMAAIPLAMFHKINYASANFITTTIGSFLFVWVIYSLATLFSVLFSDKGRATMASAGVVILMYVVYIVSTLNSNIKDLKYISIFNYFSGSELLAKNVYPEFALVALGGMAIVATIIGLLWFEKRDISV
ncbi:ABC transporter permease subunit [Candidatus Saccharibacteria bacterium]|nr:ABC transporter permease subunit [Candidatus Saccharibacteria bacterium]